MDSRIDRIIAVLKDHGMHEPNCPARAVEKANARGGLYYHPRPCDCWLAEQFDGLVAPE